MSPWDRAATSEESQIGLLAENECKEHGDSRLTRIKAYNHLQPSSVLKALSIALLGSFFFGIGWISHPLLGRNLLLQRAIPQVNIGQMIQTFETDPAFVAPPPSTNSTEPVWDTLLPTGLGYVRSLEENSSVSTIGAFHQIHCLYTLRRIYYATVQDLKAGQKEDEVLTGFDNGIDRQEHAAHCFEYLRHAIICNADPSLEPWGSTVDGFPGMGVPRVCRDYEGLKAYAEQNRVLDEKGFILTGHG